MSESEDHSNQSHEAGHEDSHTDGHGDGHGHHHDPHVAHHFDNAQQQFTSAKLGIWLFLATEILMFGGLFVAYFVYRINFTDIYLYAHQALDTKWGAINTVVLLASSFTMALGVRAAQLGQKKILTAMMLITFLGGCGFMVIKTIEYSGKYAHGLWVGPYNAFYPQDFANTPILQSSPETVAENYKEGRKYIAKYAKGGHGDKHGDDHGGDYGHGDKHGDEYADDHGGDYAEAEKKDDHAGDAAHAHDNHAHDDHSKDDHAHEKSAQLVSSAGVWPPKPVEYSVIKSPPLAGATGLAREFAADPELDPEAKPRLQIVQTFQVEGGHSYPTYEELSPRDQQRLHIFFQIYYMMTGLHGLHVLIGMGLIGYIGVRSFLGHFGPKYFTPVEVVGLYWHLVDLIWIFLFPLLYLIH